MSLPAEVKNHVKMGMVEENQKGYRENNANYAGYFFNIRKEEPKEFSREANSKFGDYDTNLKNNYQDIKLSFTISGIKSIQ